MLSLRLFNPYMDGAMKELKMWMRRMEAKLSGLLYADYQICGGSDDDVRVII